MTLEEYEKVLEEKRKALHALKTEERKVDAKEFESMQQLSNKKGNDDVFIKLVRTFDYLWRFIIREAGFNHLCCLFFSRAWIRIREKKLLIRMKRPKR